ncbi:MAG TPA: hypothetical protein VHQ65_15255 [Thermoanaerobaculia bacterium]|nr:hypothetical protein [Thermoanaerobaculia bacterium]
MGEKISWNLAVAVSNGPKAVDQRQLEVEAYDKLVVKVPGNEPSSTKKVTVDVQPSAASKVTFLYLSSTLYGDKLTYSVDGGAGNVVLDGPHLLTGAGMVGLLGGAPKKFELSNRLGKDNDAEITILVGRNAAS